VRKKIILITGASGEIGQALLNNLAADRQNHIVALDIHPIPDQKFPNITPLQGDILDRNLLSRMVSEYEIEVIYHLAALLSTRSEFTPETAHRVNVEGTLGLLQLAAEQSEWRGAPVKFIFPSSIAVYGLPDPDTKNNYAHVREWEHNTPRTMYGCNKLYCEQLGIYYSKNYRQLAADRLARRLRTRERRDEADARAALPRFFALTPLDQHEFRRSLRRWRYLRELSLSRRRQSEDPLLHTLIEAQEATGERQDLMLALVALDRHCRRVSATELKDRLEREQLRQTAKIRKSLAALARH